jgi:hypothetical protein
MLILLLTACALKSTLAIMDAEQAVLAAERAGAAELAPREATQARAWLDEAQRNQGRARYHAAEQLAAQARAFAEQASKQASVGAEGSQVVPEEKAPEPVAPEPEPEAPGESDELMEVMGKPDEPRPPPPEEKKLDTEIFEDESP